jgi:hypothetical protein
MVHQLTTLADDRVVALTPGLPRYLPGYRCAGWGNLFPRT